MIGREDRCKVDRLWSLFAQSSDAAFAIDNAQQILFWNEAAQALLGYPAEAAVGQRCWQLLGGATPHSLPFCCPACPLTGQAGAGALVGNVDVAMQTYAGPTRLVNLTTIPFPPHRRNGSRISLIHLLRPLPAPETKFGVLRLYLLGPLRVQRIDGSFIHGPHWRRISARALLVYLSRRRDRFTPAAQIGAALWPGRPPAAALQQLETAVHHLRLALRPSAPGVAASPPLILQEDDRYRLNDQIPCWSDLDYAARQLEAARREPNRQRAEAAYQEILRLFRGDYLADLSQTPVWSPAGQQRATALHLDALEGLGGLCEQGNQVEEAKRLYLTALTLDPDNGRVYHKLTHLALPHDSKHDALIHCRQAAAALRGGLDALLDDQLHNLLTNP
jgi:DNA-binding SARP family transcriptional activator